MLRAASSRQLDASARAGQQLGCADAHRSHSLPRRCVVDMQHRRTEFDTELLGNLPTELNRRATCP